MQAVQPSSPSHSFYVAANVTKHWFNTKPLLITKNYEDNLLSSLAERPIF